MELSLTREYVHVGRDDRLRRSEATLRFIRRNVEIILYAADRFVFYTTSTLDVLLSRSLLFVVL